MSEPISLGAPGEDSDVPQVSTEPQFYANGAEENGAPRQVAQDSEQQEPPQSKLKTDKLCDFYLSPKGCVKGEDCDFVHPRAPNGTITNRICDFFLKPGRGCREGDRCGFVHPQRANVKEKICDFFLSAAGCKRGFNCDYAHPPHLAGSAAAMMGGAPAAVAPSPYNPYNPYAPAPLPVSVPRAPAPSYGVDLYGRPLSLPAGLSPLSAGPAVPAVRAPVSARLPPRKTGDRPCTYFNTPRGCLKGAACDFAHVKGDTAGLAPGEEAPASQSHSPSPQPASSTASPYSSSSYTSSTIRPPPSAPGAPPKRPRVCEYFNSARGCVKAEMCDFIHQKQRPCDFWHSGKGCRKGEYCDFLHGPAGSVAASSGSSSSSSGRGRSRSPSRRGRSASPRRGYASTVPQRDVRDLMPAYSAYSSAPAPSSSAPVVSPYYDPNYYAAYAAAYSSSPYATQPPPSSHYQ